MSFTIDAQNVGTQPRRLIDSKPMRFMAIAAVGVAVMSIARILADNDDLTSSGTFGVALRTAAPIALAGLSGLVAERIGTINIGIEGMMVMGTIFAGWWGWEFGPWMAIVGGIFGGMLGGLLMSLATTTFGVNHIVAGVAINLIAPGVARFMASELFVGVQGGSVTSSPGNSGRMGSFTVPFLSGGDLFGWQTPDILGWFEDTGWFFVADLAGFLKGMTTAVTWDVLLTMGMFFGIAYLLWHTPLGLRLRFSGERPSAADSLGVSVHKMRYIGMAVSGGLAGMGGAVLVLFANRYQENQVAGRGFLGLATMIFGNWMPAGTAAGAGLFGYAQGITLRTNPGDLVRALLLAAAIGLVLTAFLMAYRRSIAGAGTILAFSLVTFWAYFAVEEPNNQLVFVTPYVVTLIAVSVGAQRLRPPAEEGIPWFKGMQ
ncbi:MAG TPA: ABC transporter permease [Ilumatobacteraceae bacterium]|nr:ABC transporter permease [Ilumatobacteraceae bacterium]